MAIEIVRFPTNKELREALDAFEGKLKIVNPYCYASVLLRAKRIIHVDWTRNSVTAEF